MNLIQILTESLNLWICSKIGRPPPKKQKDRKALTRVQSISSSDFTGNVQIVYVVSAMIIFKFFIFIYAYSMYLFVWVIANIKSAS